MARANPYDMNARKENPTFVGLDHIEDMTVDNADPLEILLTMEEDNDDGYYVDVVRKAWHTKCTDL